MTELGRDAFRTVGPGDAVPTTSSFPTTWTTASRGSRSRASRIGSTHSTISAPAPAKHAHSPGACSQGRRSCANATAPASTSRPGR